MCFSAGASFTAGAVLGTIGVISISKSKKPSQLLFAAIPMIFGIQQAFEGFVWLSFSKEEFIPWHTTLVYSFLFFAQILWPTWVPLSMSLLENDPVRKKWLKGITACGILASVITTYRLINYPVIAGIEQHHVHYSIQAPQIFMVITSVLYLISTIFPGYFSGVKHMKLLSSVMLGSLILSKIFFSVYFISVWCFFAALLSVIVLYIMKNFQTIQNKNHGQSHTIGNTYRNDHGLEH